MCPAASVPTERILVKPPCLNPLFGWDQDLTCHLGEVLQECFPCSRNMILSLLNLVAFRHSTSCSFLDLPSRLLAELLVSVLVPRCGCRQGVSVLQLLLQCQHTNLYCLWFLRKILVLCSSWGRKPVEVEVWGLERAGGCCSGIKEQESTGPGGGTAFAGTMVDSCHKAAMSVTDNCQDWCS